jgi:SNF2 family DNA or RNA helicase
LFKKQFFPEATVKSLATNQTIYEKGKELFNNNQVKDLKLNEENRSIEFTVRDEQDHHTYFSFLENGLAQKYSCDCREFQKQSGACHHVVASILYLNTINQDAFDRLNEDGIEDLEAPSSQLQLLQKNRQLLGHLFDEAKKDIEAQTISFSKTPLQFEFVLNMNPLQNAFEYEFYLKAGEEHLYVVKDIVEVVGHLLKGNNYTFGKQLTYNPQTYSILPEDRQLLSYIYEVGKTQEETINRIYGQYTANTSGALSIPPKYVPGLLEHIMEVDGGYVRIATPPKLLSSINQLEMPLVIHEGEERIPLTFTVTKEKEYFVLDVSEKDKEKKVNLHPQANMVSIDATFYLLNPTNFKKAQLLIETFRNMQQQPLQLTENDLISFYSLILPSLKELFEYEVEESIEENIQHVPLTPELYIDYVNDRLTVRPVFKYGEATLYPLASEENNKQTESLGNEGLFIRDVFQENDLLNVLSHYFGRSKIEENEYILEYLQEISLFIYDDLAELSKLMNVYLTPEAEALIYDADEAPELSIEMNRATNLLDIRFDVADVATHELPNLITQLQKTDQRFYQLESGKIIDLEEEEFQEFFENVEKIDLQPEEISEETSISLLRGLSLVNDENVAIGEELREFVKDLKEPESLNFEVPTSLQATLRPYQETGFKWLSMLDYYGLGGVLADDMGLGKTIQSITFILSKIEKQPGKYLIVSPSSVVYNWEKECEQFAPSIRTTVISGTIEERGEQLKHALETDEIDVLITSYPLIQRDIEYYQKHNFQTIILDESQNVKNDATKTTKAVRQLNANTIFALSGTPIENNLNELWSLFSITLPGLFRSKKAFNEMSEEEIAQKIDIFILRRMKEDVLDDLPPKTETIEYIELSEEQKRLYQTQLSLIRNDVESLIEEDAFEQNRMRVLAGMTRLRQICCDPRLIDESYEGGSAKLERLMEYLREALANKKRIVLFSQFTSMLAIIREILEDYGVSYHYLDGGTPKKDRLELTTRFNEGEKDIFLISLRAGGTGLNLTGGDTVILYDSWWNPAIEDQAADRVHRFGQQKSVQVIRMIMKGTIEEGINELQDQKRELIDNVIRTDDEKKVASLTKEDILGLLSD